MFLSSLNARFACLAATAVLLGAMGATAASAQIQFRGGGFVSNFVGCEQYGWSNQSVTIRARYSPAELSPANTTDMSLYLYTGTENYTRQGPLDLTFQSLQGNYIWTGAGRTIPRPRIRVLSQSPEVITESTRDIQMRFRIRNFAVLTGCQADVGLVLTRFPMLP